MRTRGRLELKQWKERSRLTLTELAKCLGVSTPYACQILTGERQPGKRIMLRITEVTGIPMHSWLTLAVSETVTGS